MCVREEESVVSEFLLQSEEFISVSFACVWGRLVMGEVACQEWFLAFRVHRRVR